MPGPQPESFVKDYNKALEDNHQAALFCWAAMPETQQLYPQLAKCLFAIPNGGERNKIVAAKLKTTGVKAGVLDLFLAVPRKLYCGLFIELKKIGGRPSPQQIAFMEEVTRNGYACHLAEGWLSARDAIVNYLQT